VHHHHHHTLRARDARSSAFCRTLIIFILVLLIVASFAVVSFIAWNFHEVAECEKQRLPWEKPCKDWLGKGSKDWLGRSGA
jgi:flagellar basal body-associated protein FliL